MRENPGPDVAVQALRPPQTAPMTAEMDPISSSICTKLPLQRGISAAMRSAISEAGVMG